MLTVKGTKKEVNSQHIFAKGPHTVKSWKLIDNESQLVFCM